MTRKDRKRLAQQKYNQTLLEINECFTEAFKRTRDWDAAIKLTEKYCNKQMNDNPQEIHVWERAAMEWQDKLVDEIKREMNR